jgi:hypothetical protein
MEYGIQCTTGIGVHTGHGAESGNTNGVRGTANIIGDTDYDIWAEAKSGYAVASAGGCLGLNNMTASNDDTAGTTYRSTLSASVLQSAPSLSNWNGVVHNASTIDLGQRGHGLNESGYGSWPYILAIEFNTDNLVEYGSDAINVEYGNTDDYTDISILNNSPSDETHIHLSITDPALNIDPTNADKWIFNLPATDSTDSDGYLFFVSNMTDTNGPDISAESITLAETGDMGCTDNCKLGNSTTLNTLIVGGNEVIMTESDVNSAVFESWATNGTSQLVTADEAGGDGKVVFTYGGDSADLVITYNDAELTFDAGAGDWIAQETAYVTVNDPDMNKYPGMAETLDIGDEDAIIPTIKMGTPLTLANSDGNDNLKSGASNNVNGVIVGQDEGDVAYTLTVYNTTDNSERLRIINSAITDEQQGTDLMIGGSAHSNTWINVTTAHTYADLVNLPGTAVLNYDISGPAGDLGSTAVAVYVLGTGKNSSGTNDIEIVASGNTRAGIFDLDDGTQQIKNTDISDSSFSGSTTTGGVATTNVGVAFKITHPVGKFLNATHDYAIAADFCNFDQDNGSNTHNCIYRIC